MLQRFISPVPLTLTVEVGGVTKKVTFARLRTGTGELVTDDEGVAEALRRHPYFNKILTAGETPTDGVLVGTVVDVVVEKSVEEQVAELRATIGAKAEPPKVYDFDYELPEGAAFGTLAIVRSQEGIDEYYHPANLFLRGEAGWTRVPKVVQGDPISQYGEFGDIGFTAGSMYYFNGNRWVKTGGIPTYSRQSDLPRNPQYGDIAAIGADESNNENYAPANFFFSDGNGWMRLPKFIYGDPQSQYGEFGDIGFTINGVYYFNGNAWKKIGGDEEDIVLCTRHCSQFGDSSNITFHNSALNNVRPPLNLLVEVLWDETVLDSEIIIVDIRERKILGEKFAIYWTLRSDLSLEVSVLASAHSSYVNQTEADYSIRLTWLRSDVSVLKRSVSSLEDSVSSLEDSVSSLEDSVSSLEDDGTILLGNVAVNPGTNYAWITDDFGYQDTTQKLLIEFIDSADETKALYDELLTINIDSNGSSNTIGENITIETSNKEGMYVYFKSSEFRLNLMQQCSGVLKAKVTIIKNDKALIGRDVAELKGEVVELKGEVNFERFERDVNDYSCVTVPKSKIYPTGGDANRAVLIKATYNSLLIRTSSTGNIANWEIYHAGLGIMAIAQDADNVIFYVREYGNYVEWLDVATLSAAAETAFLARLVGTAISGGLFVQIIRSYVKTVQDNNEDYYLLQTAGKDDSGSVLYFPYKSRYVFWNDIESAGSTTKTYKGMAFAAIKKTTFIERFGFELSDIDEFELLQPSSYAQAYLAAFNSISSVVQLSENATFNGDTGKEYLFEALADVTLSFGGGIGNHTSNGRYAIQEDETLQLTQGSITKVRVISISDGLTPNCKYSHYLEVNGVIKRMNIKEVDMYG